MNKIKYPIIFINEQELIEAKQCNVVDFKTIDSSFNYPYLLTCENGGQVFDTWKKKSILIKIQDALFWSEVKEQYKPKLKWFDSQSFNGGKIVWVRNSENANWKVDIFRRYQKLEDNKFLCETNNWKYAKPVKAINLIKNETM